jgi:hypothetical protein
LVAGSSRGGLVKCASPLAAIARPICLAARKFLLGNGLSCLIETQRAIVGQNCRAFGGDRVSRHLVAHAHVTMRARSSVLSQYIWATANRRSLCSVFFELSESPLLLSGRRFRQHVEIDT